MRSCRAWLRASCGTFRAAIRPPLRRHQAAYLLRTAAHSFFLLLAGLSFEAGAFCCARHASVRTMHPHPCLLCFPLFAPPCTTLCLACRASGMPCCCCVDVPCFICNARGRSKKGRVRIRAEIYFSTYCKAVDYWCKIVRREGRGGVLRSSRLRTSKAAQ